MHCALCDEVKCTSAHPTQGQVAEQASQVAGLGRREDQVALRCELLLLLLLFLLLYLLFIYILPLLLHALQVELVARGA